ncbi:putative carbonic anhydrase YvdA [Weizmannia acidilactici]|uniref:carbonic anhydrase n=1 Tax=Weizmannia acidilactici TaxID=2607726 RepID=A0A5J4JH15_9BACI|nr:carbonic anhydrase [Weizmannia acidilactici]GER66737.1 putative carbonic anhydrase YvdA [Weizmannia acidilactici]GER70619.1 putative carbonic anhydrase YvdA [Weizmannia acidilactici]GER73792.1 putative carbonic anhydrase YvdA [Weizmannia acidilactici]
MTLLDNIMAFNEEFVEKKEYEPYTTSKFPDKRMVIFTCMDTRIIELLHKAMNIKNGDAKIVKNAGAILTSPFDSTMRSLLVAIYQLKADEVFVIGHYDCGMTGLKGESVLTNMKKRGVEEKTIETLTNAGIDLGEWLSGFDRVENSVEKSVGIIKNHPLMDKKVPVHGLVIDPETGKLDLVINGYEN